MDKNMIKIDDLLRQRLGDAEEQDRPAAWMQMRDLLDKQMPVTKAAVNWRRMFAYVAGVALLAAVSVGGYEMSQSFSTDGNIVDNNIGSKAQGSPATTGLAGSAINSLPDTRVAAEVAAQPAPATDAANGNIASNNTTANGNNSQQTGTNTTAQQQPNVQQTVTKANKHSKNGNKSQQLATNTTAKADTRPENGNNSQQMATKPSVDATRTTSSGTSGKNSNPLKDSKLLVKNNTNSNNPNINSTPNTTNTNKTANTTKNTQVTPVPQSVGNSNKNVTPTANGNISQQNIAGNNNGTKPSAEKNNKNAQPEVETKEIPINKIERVGKEGVAGMDTIFNGKDVKKVTVPKKGEMLAKNDDDASGSNIMPASAAPSAKKELSADDAPMQKLGDHKVASKKMKNYNSNRFEEMVKNAKFRMGSVKFYPGIVGGANVSFNGNMGVQAGLAGNLSVSDRWSILTEVKYTFRYNNTKQNMQDDFIDNVQPANINGQYVYTYDSMEHYYNFSNYTSLDIPVLATYTNNRYVFMLGGNFSYNFKINNLQEVEQRYLLEQSSTTTTQVKFETDKKILLSDFAPTMNIAPMIGFGYQIRPAFRLDCRLSKSVWNNANTFGQKEISKSLYNKPQMQLNLTYRFSSNKHKPYKRAQ